LDIRPHTIRYWETEFVKLKTKTKKGYSRRYSSKDVEYLKVIKELIYDRKFTLEGAVAEVKKAKTKLHADNDQGSAVHDHESNDKIVNIKKELVEVKNMLLKRKDTGE